MFSQFIVGSPNKLRVYQIQAMRSYIGKIAFYMRLYRTFTRHPQTGSRGFARNFPDPAVNFHSWLYDDCTLNSFVFF